MKINLGAFYKAGKVVVKHANGDKAIINAKNMRVIEHVAKDGVRRNANWRLIFPKKKW